jgi:hypothetical protein
MKGWRSWRNFFDWRGAVGFIVISALAGFLGEWWLGIPYWVATGFAAFALLVNGLIIMWEDRKGI